MQWSLTSEDLARKRAELEAGRLEHETALKGILDELSALDDLDKKIASLGILPEQKPLPGVIQSEPQPTEPDERIFTQKETVLRAVIAHPSGADRATLIKHIQGHLKAEIEPSNVTTYLWRLKQDEAVKSKDGLWYPTRKGSNYKGFF